MPIQDVNSELERAKTLASEAWDIASNAKEKSGEARAALTAVAGQTPPGNLGAALTALDAGAKSIEEGQAAMTGAQELIEKYLDQLNG